MMSYYIKKIEEHKSSCACILEIDWNVFEISGKKNANGYIVQKYSRKLIPQNALPVKEYCDISYFEAWQVKNGKIVSEDKGSVCDDRFQVGNGINTSDEFCYSIGTKATYKFNGIVYWIDANSKLFKIVDSWDRQSIKQAGKLKGVENFDEIKAITPVFIRDTFVHTWDLSTNEKIYDAAKAELSYFFNNKKLEDTDFFLANVEAMFNGKCEDIKDRIIDEWNNL